MLALREPESTSFSSNPFVAHTAHSAPAPAPKGAGLLSWYRGLLAEPKPPTKLQSAVVGMRHYAEGGLVGGVLALAETEFGTLDYNGKYPVDALAAGLLYLLSVRDSDAGDGFASDLRAMGQSCVTVYSYRKTKAWRAASKALVAPSATVKPSQDPLIMAARDLGV